MSRTDRLLNDPTWPHEPSTCDDGEPHRWLPLSFVFETQLLDDSGRVVIRQPDTEKGRVYAVCMTCRSHTYIETEWVGYYLGSPGDDGGGTSG